MTFKIFIDSDIILDVLSKREPFYDSAAILFSLIEKGQVKGVLVQRKVDFWG